MDIRGKAVYFDTNSYRNLTKKIGKNEVIEKFNTITEKEKLKDIQVHCSVITLLELISNLHKQNFNYENCLNSVIAMSYHCYDNGSYRITPNAYLLIINSIFKRTPSGVIKNIKSLGGLLKDFKNNENDALKHYKKQDLFNRYKSYTDDLEKDFVFQISTLIDVIKNQIKNENSTINNKHLREKTLNFINSQEFNLIFSKSLINFLSKKVGLELSSFKIEEVSDYFIREFPLGSGFYQWVCNEVYSKNIDLNSKTSIQKRWNWIWDYNIAFAINNSTINQRETILIISDKDIKEILCKFGYENKVISVNKYLKLLNE